MEKVILKTEDGLDIVGDYYEGRGKRGVLLLHMMPANRSSWWDFALRLEDKGFHALAIDLRGHGESTGGPDGYKDFKTEDHALGKLDLEAAITFLEEKGVEREELGLMGASIGANLALRQLSENKDLPWAVLLSPGLDYHGIKTEPYVRNLDSEQGVFIIASDVDELKSGNCGAMARELYAALPEGLRRKLLIYKSAGHGTDMFAPQNTEEPNLAEEILKWID